jgi:hypothetical protein
MEILKAALPLQSPFNGGIVIVGPDNTKRLVSVFSVLLLISVWHKGWAAVGAWFRHKDNDVDHYPTACPPNRSKTRPQEISLWAGSFQFLPVAYRLCFLISVFLTNITD